MFDSFGPTWVDALELVFAPELVDLAAVALRRPAGRRGTEIPQRFSLFYQPQPQLAACICFTIERSGNRCRAAHGAEQQDLYLKVRAVGPDLEQVVNVDLTGRLGRLPVGANPSQLTRSRSQGTRLKEPAGPEPLVDANARHVPIVLQDRVNCLMLAKKSPRSQRNRRHPTPARATAPRSGDSRSSL